MAALIEGQPIFVQGSGKKPYELKNVGGVYSCTCVAWKMQGIPIDRRTCKHLKAHCGVASEEARVSGISGFSQVGATSGRGQTAGPNVAAEPRTSPGCACERGFTCDVAHDPATCPCAQCTMAEAKSKMTASPERAKEILDRAASQGRKLRPDEKTKLHGPPVLLAHPYEDFDDLDPAGWWYSEKLDGVRAWWDGKNFISRQGNVFYAPEWFKAGLPDHLLDGELWMGRGKFQRTISVVRRQDGGDAWKDIRYVVFDAPHVADKTFEERISVLKGICERIDSPYLKYHEHHKVQSREHLAGELKSVESLGGEGLMIRKPGSTYEAGRSATILKVKPFKEAEGVIVGHAPGKGRHKGSLGGLTLRMPNGKEFNVGTGLTDEMRRSPPKIGLAVTYRYTELTDSGIPKCASFVAVRDYE